MQYEDVLFPKERFGPFSQFPSHCHVMYAHHPRHSQIMNGKPALLHVALFHTSVSVRFRIQPPPPRKLRRRISASRIISADSERLGAKCA